jgi:dipeptidyl aminopeptidase/acylaminoacyl peptidase
VCGGEYPLVSDGPRIYLTEWVNGHLVVGQIAAAGGELARLPLSLGRDHLVDAMSPDGSEVLVGTPELGKSEEQFYALPLVGGTARRLPDVLGHSTSWLPDGRILYTRGREVFLAARDGTAERLVMTLPGRAYWLRLSPDGTLLRFTLFREGVRHTSIWEARVDGSGLRQLLQGASDLSRECCGEWTPDGRYYLFQATRQNVSHIWALREAASRFTLKTPPAAQLTEGPVQFRRVLPSRDGRKLFAVGRHLHGELSRYMPAAEGLTSPTWSPDGRHLVAARPPPGGLVLYDVESSRWSDLVTAPADRPVWSPDSRHVYFLAYEGLPRVTSVSCVRLRDRMVKQVAPIADVPLVWGGAGFWLGLTPDEAPLLLRDRSRHDLYALDWRAP